MRLLAVMAGVVVGLSGCFGAPIVHRTPAGNETAESPQEGGAGDDLPPWTLNGTGKTPDLGGGSKTDGGTKKSDPDGGGGGGNETKNSTDDPPPPPDGNETGFGQSGVGGTVQGALDEVPTSGAPKEPVQEEDVGDAVGDVDETSKSKDPVGDAADDAGDAAEKNSSQQIPDASTVLFGS